MELSIGEMTASSETFCLFFGRIGYFFNFFFSSKAFPRNNDKSHQKISLALIFKLLLVGGLFLGYGKIKPETSNIPEST